MLEHYIFTSGPVIYPLLFCSLLALALVLERLLVLLFYPAMLPAADVQAFQAGTLTEAPEAKGARQGLILLARYRGQNKSLRDELLSTWLAEQQQVLHGRIRWLTLVGTLAPLLGLLGTVLGIISMFQEVAHQAGPVTPALLAAGMWEAMATTAMGLVIAIPALGCGQAFAIWGDHRLEKIGKVLNQNSLWLELHQTPVSDSVEVSTPLAKVQIA